MLDRRPNVRLRRQRKRRIDKFQLLAKLLKGKYVMHKKRGDGNEKMLRSARAWIAQWSQDEQFFLHFLTTSKK